MREQNTAKARHGAIVFGYQPILIPVVHDTPAYSPPSFARSFMSANCTPDCSFSR
jgi:hypothetical protein